MQENMNKSETKLKRIKRDKSPHGPNKRIKLVRRNAIIENARSKTGRQTNNKRLSKKETDISTRRYKETRQNIP